mmetsp:Transcript_22344/g.57231  ORF Transcript_22344/g.57231 Transcript_22344/m.57231 type:complete len:266 (-) Transcript_22344:343-1140(-)
MEPVQPRLHVPAPVETRPATFKTTSRAKQESREDPPSAPAVEIASQPARQPAVKTTSVSAWLARQESTRSSSKAKQTVTADPGPDKPLPKPLPSGMRFVEGTVSSKARQEPPIVDRLAPREPPATESLPESSLGEVQLNTSRLVLRKMEALAASEFPSEQMMPELEAEAAAEAARRACGSCTEAAGGYSNLPPIADTVDPFDRRLVPKQLDARWVATRSLRPRMETLWSIDDHLAGVCDTQASAPFYKLSRTDVASLITSTALCL